MKQLILFSAFTFIVFTCFAQVKPKQVPTQRKAVSVNSNKLPIVRVAASKRDSIQRKAVPANRGKLPIVRVAASKRDSIQLKAVPVDISKLPSPRSLWLPPNKIHSKKVPNKQKEGPSEMIKKKKTPVKLSKKTDANGEGINTISRRL